jgi:cytochrome c553
MNASKGCSSRGAAAFRGDFSMLRITLLLSVFLVDIAPAGAGGLADVVVQCAACHGADGIAKSVDVPHLAGQHELYLLDQIKAFRSGKRPHKEMRFMSRQLTDSEMEEIAHYYSQMPR